MTAEDRDRDYVKPATQPKPESEARTAAKEFRKAWNGFFKSIESLLVERINLVADQNAKDSEYCEGLKIVAGDVATASRYILEGGYLDWLEDDVRRYLFPLRQHRLDEVRWLTNEMNLVVAQLQRPSRDTATNPESSAEDDEANTAEQVKGSVANFVKLITSGLGRFLKKLPRIFKAPSELLNDGRYKEESKSVLDYINEMLKMFRIG